MLIYSFPPTAERWVPLLLSPFDIHPTDTTNNEHNKSFSIKIWRCIIGEAKLGRVSLYGVPVYVKTIHRLYVSSLLPVPKQFSDIGLALTSHMMQPRLRVSQ